jgi:hypothetical protein
MRRGATSSQRTRKSSERLATHLPVERRIALGRPLRQAEKLITRHWTPTLAKPHPTISTAESREFGLALLCDQARHTPLDAESPPTQLAGQQVVGELSEIPIAGGTREQIQPPSEILGHPIIPFRSALKSWPDGIKYRQELTSVNGPWKLADDAQD